MGEGNADTTAIGHVDRRAMLKGAAAAGAAAAVWVAPRIETLGFAPAGAQGTPVGTPCIILSPSADDRESQSGQNYCPVVTEPCCGQSFGNAGQIETFTFTNPAPDCSQIVVRTIALDCFTGNSQPERNPDVGQFAVVIESTTGTGCGVCTVLDAVLIASSGRQVLKSLNNGPFSCANLAPNGTGVDASLACNDPLLVSSSRLAVRLSCITGEEDCVVLP